MDAVNPRKVFASEMDTRTVDISNSWDIGLLSNGIHTPNLRNATKPKEKRKIKNETPLN